ncbi:MAG: hypothetical protein JXO22_09745, partial [Phycisphaerae bacterium]|nr:hypothetical protein [Phycisphaerae bacterium]
CAALDVRCLIVESGREYSWRKVRQSLRPRVLRAKLYRSLRPILFRPDCDSRRFFFGDSAPHFTHTDLLHRVPHINCERTVKYLQESNVELLAVFGTSLLRRNEFFAKWAGRILNLHGGLSPWYRGADSTFWALYHGEPRRVGATVHHIDRRIDAGLLLAHAYPEVHPGDGEERLFCRAIEIGADAYVQAIERLQRGDSLGVRQPPGGHLFFTHQRRYYHDAELRRRIARGEFDGLRLPAHIEWFMPGTGTPRTADARGVIADNRIASHADSSASEMEATRTLA